MELFRSPRRGMGAHGVGAPCRLEKEGRAGMHRALSWEKQTVEDWDWLKRKAGLQGDCQALKTLGGSPM